jgi:drug/metabolite transporter (DMT)-like permease
VSPGLRDMALAAFFFSIMSLLVRTAGEEQPSWQIVLARAFVSLVLGWIVLRGTGRSPWGTHRRLLFLRGLLGFGGLSCFYWALVHLPLAEATVIQYTNPIFTALLAAVLLGERMARLEVAALLGCAVGVLLVTRPSALFGGTLEPLPLLPVLVALLGAVLSAGAYVTVRKLGASEHPLVVVFWFPLVATPLSLPAVLTTWVTPSARGWLLLLGVGIATHIAQLFMTRGLQREPAGRATAVSYLQIVFAACWGLLFLGERPAWPTVLGALLIGGCVMVLALQRRKAT